MRVGARAARACACATVSSETRIPPAAAWASSLAARLTTPPIAVKSLRPVVNSPYLDLTRVEANANTKRIRRRLIERSGYSGERGFAAPLDVECRRHGRLRVALDLDRKIEDRHYAIAHLLVDDTVVRPVWLERTDPERP